MQLSEAIRLGAMLRPQARGWLVRDVFVPTRGWRGWLGRGKMTTGTCALGAALEAVGMAADLGSVWHMWPWTLNRSELCPVCPVCGIARMASGIIWHLNDSHDWTREQIADWVATIEPREDTKPIESTVVVAVVV